VLGGWFGLLKERRADFFQNIFGISATKTFAHAISWDGKNGGVPEEQDAVSSPSPRFGVGAGTMFCPGAVEA
jgi:hypothetical protein